MKKLFFLLFFLILFSVNVLSMPPYISKGDFKEGLTISFSSDGAIKQNEDFDFHAHVFNTSNGAFVENGVSCYFHLYNITGSQIYKGFDNTVNNDFDFDFDIDGMNFSEPGRYISIIQCNLTTGAGGFTSISFDVNPSGTSYDFDFSLMALIFIPLIFGFFCLIGSFILDSEEHSAMKIGFLLLSFISVFFSLLVGQTVVGEMYAGITALTNVISFLMWVFGILIGIVFTYFIIYLFIKAMNRTIQADKDIEEGLRF